MRLKLLFILTLLVISGLSKDMFAQGKRQREYSGFFDSYYYRGPITYTIGFNAAAYRGDLAESIGLGSLGYGASIGANYKVWPMIALGAEFTYFTLKSKDTDIKRNISFSSTNMELLVYGRLYFFDEVVRISPDRKKEKDLTFFKPYLTTGVAFLMYSPVSVNNGTLPDSAIGGPETKRYPGYGPAIPVGLGFSIHPSHKLSFAVEATYRFTFTDYLDDVSKRGNPSKKDGYAFLGLKVQYAPTAPKKKKKMSLPPPAQYDGPKGTKTWKNTPREDPKPKRTNNYYEEETTPSDENQEDNGGWDDGTNQNQEDNGGGDTGGQENQEPKQNEEPQNDGWQ